MNDPDFIPMEQLIVLFGVDQAAIEDAAAEAGVPVSGGIVRARVEEVREVITQRARKGRL